MSSGTIHVDRTEKDQHNKSHWCEEEFNEVSFGDHRLNRRLISIAKDLSDQPLEPINQASQNACRFDDAVGRA